MSSLDWVAFILLVVGGLNWGLVGAFQYNVVTTLFGAMSTATNVVYILVGLAAVYKLWKVCMMSMK